LRETKSIIEFGLADSVIIASAWEEGLKTHEKIDEFRTVVRYKLFFDKFKKNFLTFSFRYLEFIIKVFFAYCNKKITTVNCHSLFVLPVGYLLKVYNHKTWLIYDAHELESEKTGLGNRGRKISGALEKFLIKKVDKVIVVSPSIASWYQTRYPLSAVIVIKNTPEFYIQREKHFFFHTHFNIPKSHLIFIYQGVVNKGRGIEMLIEAFKTTSVDKHLVIMGYGPLVHLVKESEASFSNIHFMPAVPPSEIVYYTSAADVGISMIENVSLSYYYCLPNKFFEYIQCGLPQVVSAFPDMSGIINHYDCGWTCSPSPSSFKSFLDSISCEEISKRRDGVAKAKAVLNWETESSKLRLAFREVP
jgi:glycosyltransferase involved in cell wall biosynthesis